MQKPPGIAGLDGLSMSTALRTESRALSDDFGLHVNLLCASARASASCRRTAAAHGDEVRTRELLDGISL